MGIKLFDVAQTNISKHFIDVSDYIDEALNEGGKSSIFTSNLKILFLYNILIKISLISNILGSYEKIFVEILIPLSYSLYYTNSLCLSTF